MKINCRRHVKIYIKNYLAGNYRVTCHNPCFFLKVCTKYVDLSFSLKKQTRHFSLHILSIPTTNSALGLCCSSVQAGMNLNVSQCGCNLAADPLIRQALQSPAAGHSSHFTGCPYSPGWFYWERWLGSCQRPLSLAYTHTHNHTHTETHCSSPWKFEPVLDWTSKYCPNL